MKANLKKIDEKNHISAIYTQLQFHIIVLSSSSPFPLYFQKSRTLNHRKTDSTAADMENHLKAVIKKNIENIDASLDAEDLLLTSVESSSEIPESPFVVVPELERDEEIKKQK